MSKSFKKSPYTLTEWREGYFRSERRSSKRKSEKAKLAANTDMNQVRFIRRNDGWIAWEFVDVQ